MKSTFKITCFALALVLGFSTAACSDSGGGGKIVNSAEALKEYLDSQPANSPDKPIKVAMNANNLAFQRIAAAITSSGKYVSLDLSGSPITTIPDYAFFDEDTEEGCTGLTGIILPKNVTSIGELAFRACENLTSVTIPNSVTSIGDYAFYGCSLTGITIPNSVTSIGSVAFGWCTSLTSVTIPNSVTSIGSDAFCFCTSLTSVTIPDSVTSIGDFAFGRCTSLKSVAIPDSVTSIGDAAFSYCTSLTAINVVNNNTAYSSQGGVLYNKDKTTLIQYPGGKTGAFTIPNSAKSIGDGAFKNCTSLTGLTIPNSVTSIGSDAFWFCTSLTSVTIPNSVTRIGSLAFEFCENLTSVTFEGTITSANFSSDVPFPGDLRAKYLAASGGIGTYTRPNGESETWTKQ